MQTRTKDMTSGSPIRLILLFSLPLMLGNVFQQGYTIIDSIIVGRGVGVQALAALGAADWINWLFLWAIHGFTNGLSVPIAQAFGAEDSDSLRKAVAMITLLCGGIGLFLTVAGLLSAAPLLHLMQTEDVLFAGAYRYLQVLFAGTFAVIAYNMAAAILRCMGDSRTPLLAMVAAACINIALDLLFVMVFEWGIFGAALATVLAQFVAFCYCLWVLRRLLRIEKQDWAPDRVLLLRLLRLGIPPALQNGIIAVGGMVLQSVINGFGVAFVAGFTATNKLYGVLESTAISLGYAMVAYMGQNRGARRTDRIDKGMRSVLLLCVIFSSAIALTMIVFGHDLLRLFVSAKEQHAAEVIEIAYRYLFIMSCPLLLLFFVHVYRSALQGLGNMFAALLSGVLEMTMRIAAALLLPLVMGRDGIFYAEVAAWGSAGIYMMLYYYTHISEIKQNIVTSA